MTTRKKQDQFKTAFSAIAGLNMRRAYVSTACGKWKRLYDDTKDEAAKKKYLSYQTELNQIDVDGLKGYANLRETQTQYIVEYECEVVDADSGELVVQRSKEALHFFTVCKIDTYTNGWEMENDVLQGLLYEIAEYLVQYKSAKYVVLNVKSV